MNIYVSDPRYSRWCLVGELGSDLASHVALCGARLDAADPYFIAGTVPDDDVCVACRAKRDECAGMWVRRENPFRLRNG